MDAYHCGGTGWAARCTHGYTRLQGCRACPPTSPLDWREDYEARVYGAAERGAAVHAAVERDLSNPSPDADRELNEVKGL